MNLVFGDSFGKFLTLINTFDVKVFSGKTMKGFTKKDSPVFQEITNTIKNGNKKNKNLIFVFGNVDLHLSFYYDFFMKKENENIISLKELNKKWKEDIAYTAEKYIKLIANIKVSSENKKIVLAVFPSTLNTDKVAYALEKYISFNYTNLSEAKKKLFLQVITFENRNKRLNYFNKILKKNCEENKIIFNNTVKKLINSDKSVKKELIDYVSNLNIHLLYETLLSIYATIPFYIKLGITKEKTDKLKGKLKKFLNKKKKEIMALRNEKDIKKEEKKKR